MDNIFHKMGLLAILAAVNFSLAVGLLNSVSAQNLSKLEQALEGTKENTTMGNMTGGATIAGGNATMGGNATTES
ncbi:MAG TPA: hypothetical protein VH415_06385 [Nitrososphaeraceae archaeon]|jgi:hypothetical protein